MSDAQYFDRQRYSVSTSGQSIGEEDASLSIQTHHTVDEYSHAANDRARRGRLASYQQTLSPFTLRRHKNDLASLCRCIADCSGILVGDLFSDIFSWEGITWGILQDYKEWQLACGYSVGSINLHLATVKCYARIAFESEVLDQIEYLRIKNVRGYDPRQARNIDEKREVTRLSTKKSEPTPISMSHIRALREKLEQDPGYIACRDLLIICLIAYQSLRCGEIAGLLWKNIDLVEAQFTVSRHKVNKVQKHQMHPATLMAAQRYMQVARPGEKLFEGVDRPAWTDRHGKYHVGSCAADGLSRDAIYARVRKLGELVGIEKLSPHDLRHLWTKDAFAHESPLDVVMQGGGWKDAKMPMHYRGENAIANKGIKQSL